MEQKIFGARLAYFRKKEKMTQAELAEAADIATRSFQEIEYGNTVPGIDTVIRICKALKIPISALTDGHPGDVKPKENVESNTYDYKTSDQLTPEMIELISKAASEMAIMKMNQERANASNQVTLTGLEIQLLDKYRNGTQNQRDLVYAILYRDASKIEDKELRQGVKAALKAV